MIRTASTAALFALALAGAAQAYDPVGGGSATISGGGDDMVITYSTGGAGGGMAFNSQSARLARFAGNSDGAQVEYLTSAPANPGPHARLVGGGDAEIVYGRRRAGRPSRAGQGGVSPWPASRPAPETRKPFPRGITAPATSLGRDGPRRRLAPARGHDDADAAGHGLHPEVPAMEPLPHPPAARHRFPPLFRDPAFNLAHGEETAEDGADLRLRHGGTARM